MLGFRGKTINFNVNFIDIERTHFWLTMFSQSSTKAFFSVSGRSILKRASIGPSRISKWLFSVRTELSPDAILLFFGFETSLPAGVGPFAADISEYYQLYLSLWEAYY